MKRRELAGERFGRLIVSDFAFSRRGAFWSCRCACGSTTIASGRNLLKGHTRSCGCLRLEIVRRLHVTHGNSIGRGMTPEYRSWLAMKRRCTNPNFMHYRYYGGRGIGVCDRWRDSFENFLADMGERPSLGHSIDRINNNGNYEPRNCRWVTRSEQRRNRRTPQQMEG